MPGSPPVCEATNLRKAFGDLVAVDGVSFHIAAGEVYGLLGPNGAGKSTSISMVCGLLHRDGGDVSICGEDVDDGPRARRHIGYVPQDVALYPDLSGRENLVFWGRMYGLHGADLETRVDDVLDRVDLADRARDLLKTYSGGMARRINIAAGLLHTPDLLILDEPTVGVDPQSRNAILGYVEELNAAGLSVLYTTHYMEEAERLCHRVGIIDEGKVIAEGTRRELIGLTGDQDRVVLTFESGVDLDAAAAVCRGVEGVASASRAEEGVQALCPDSRSVLPRLVGALADAASHLAGVEVEEPNLEAVFLHLTGKSLRD